MTSVAQQVAHTAQTLDWFIEGASRPEGFDLNFEADAQALATLTSLAAARQKFAAAFDNAINFVRSRSPEELASPLSPGMVMGGRTHRQYRLGDDRTHLIIAGTLTVYSRLLGKVPPMPYGG